LLLQFDSGVLTDAGNKHTVKDSTRSLCTCMKLVSTERSLLHSLEF
jgi:hypothetical protein